MAKNFEKLQRDNNRVPIMTGSGILTSDATGTPQTSPLTINATVTTIVVPTNAAEMVVQCNADLKISEAVGMATYFTLSAGVALALPLSATDTIYLSTVSGAGILQFYFVKV